MADRLSETTSAGSSSAGSSFSNLIPSGSDAKSCGLKVTVITVIALGAIALVTGILATLVSNGIYPHGFSATHALTKLGSVYGGVLIGVGCLLVALGSVAYSRYSCKKASPKT